jgi:pyruvate, water dikinase
MIESIKRPRAGLGDDLRWLSDVGPRDRALVGGKGASLGELMRVGLRVPDGFVLSATAFERFLDESGLRGPIEAAVRGLDPSDTAAVTQASGAASELIKGAQIPFDIAEAVHAAYDELAREGGDSSPPVAVRSSAAAEDGAEESFAGLLDTYLEIRGAERVTHHVRLCWASLYTPQAVAYRAWKSAAGGERALASMSVVVQRMVNARVAGVMFTCSPTSGDPSVIAINAVWGLGLGVVSSDLTPDEYWLDKVSMTVTRRRIASKTEQFVPGDRESGVERRGVPREQQREACLTDEEALALAAMGRRVEERYGAAQDIEWAIGSAGTLPDNIFLLQSRPETVFSRWAASTPLMKPSDDLVDYVLSAMLGARFDPGAWAKAAAKRRRGS